VYIVSTIVQAVGGGDESNIVHFVRYGLIGICVV